MKIPLIEIDIEDIRRYGLIASLVDREDFLTDILDARKTLKLSKVPYALPKYENLPETNYITNAYKSGLVSINYAKMVLLEECYRKGFPNLNYLDKTLGGAVVFSESLLKKYKKNQLYFPAIFGSILVGKVVEDDFRSTFMLEVDPKDIPQEVQISDSEDKVTTIVVYPESTQKDVLWLYDFIQKDHFRTKKTRKTDIHIRNNEEDFLKMKLPDTASRIKRNREWYWLNHTTNPSRQGYRKIAKLTGENVDTVKGGISAYKQFLSTPL